MRRFVLVSYDIVEDRVRNRVSRQLLYYGRRVQQSVYECVIDDRQFLEMRSRVEREVDMEVDSVRYYILCRKCVGLVEVVGLGTVTEDDSEGVFVI